jgi:hypothetical protein
VLGHTLSRTSQIAAVARAHPFHDSAQPRSEMMQTVLQRQTKLVYLEGDTGCSSHPLASQEGSALLESHSGEIPVHSEILLRPPPGDWNWRLSANGRSERGVQHMRAAAQAAADQIGDELARTDFNEETSVNPSVMAASARAKGAPAPAA